MSRSTTQVKVRPCPREVVSRVLRMGRRVDGRFVSFKIITLPNEVRNETFWAAIVGAKQCTRAVDRHRFKRIVRETIQVNSCDSFAGHAIVVLLRRSPSTPIPWPDISQEIQQTLLGAFRGS